MICWTQMRGTKFPLKFCRHQTINRFRVASAVVENHLHCKVTFNHNAPHSMYTLACILRERVVPVQSFDCSRMCADPLAAVQQQLGADVSIENLPMNPFFVHFYSISFIGPFQHLLPVMVSSRSLNQLLMLCAWLFQA